MKRSAKTIDIKNPEVIFPFVAECIFRHYKRYSFKGFVKHSDSRKFQETYGTAKAFKAAASVVSRHDRKRSKDHGKSLF